MSEYGSITCLRFTSIFGYWRREKETRGFILREDWKGIMRNIYYIP